MIEIKVGDFVETVEGDVGYITAVQPSLSMPKTIHGEFLTIRYKLSNDGETVLYHGASLYQDLLYKNFKQIGTVVFIEPIKKPKIEPLISYNVTTISTSGKRSCIPIPKYPSDREMMDKVNEIIDYINEEEKQ